MRLPRLTPLLLAASSAHALRDASPFFLLSSEPLPSDAPLQSSQIALNEAVQKQLVETLEACDRRRYYIFEQKYVAAEDLKIGMPKLQARMEGVEKGALVEVPESVVMWDWNVRNLQDQLTRACVDKGKKDDEDYEIIVTSLPALPSEAKARDETLAETDTILDETVASVLGKEDSAVLIYITIPRSRAPDAEQYSDVYEMDEPYPDAPHTDLKRDFGLHARQSDDDMQAGLPLFEKYQFLSPPIFMGLSVSILLLLILSVGLNAISGLEVSYAAFSKENGPQSQKPKQQ